MKAMALTAVLTALCLSANADDPNGRVVELSDHQMDRVVAGTGDLWEWRRMVEYGTEDTSINSGDFVVAKEMDSSSIRL